MAPFKDGWKEEIVSEQELLVSKRLLFTPSDHKCFQVEYILWSAHTSSSTVKVDVANEKCFLIFLFYLKEIGCWNWTALSSSGFM